MIVSRKTQYGSWMNLKGYNSRLSGPYYYDGTYKVNGFWHRLYGESYGIDWDLNNKSFEEFKGVDYDS